MIATDAARRVDPAARQERPLVFHGPEVRALLAGRKRSDRRRAKLPPELANPDDWEATTLGGPGRHDDEGRPTPQRPILRHLQAGQFLECPWELGDRLWVRETWCRASDDAIGDEDPQGRDGRPRGPEYRPDPGSDTTLRPWVFYRATDAHVVNANDEDRSPWRSAMNMPRWAARLILEVTGVRAHRLQGLTRDDAIAEGAFFTDYGKHEHQLSTDGGTTWNSHSLPRAGWSMVETERYSQCLGSPQMAYANRWNVIHAGENWNLSDGPSPWDLDPWVWALGLRIVEPAP